ncbi:MAG: DUF1330 domain-containing protein [SAR86 cluster bacterium]|uniref:DUF1330 domain-containing protein n=1 Tax=SAR86 cluster bacterium TaxID=2030880 RepID=A0A520MAJ3_9GAMM|nr:MAG: DUF1330 domain-containing protein [SAR86 cluster bacterium]
MKGYWVARCHVTNLEEYSKYIELAGPIIESFGGKFLVRGGIQIEVEGGNFERTVLVEFENMEVAKKCYESDEYQGARKHTIGSSIRHIVLAEGI